MFCNFYESKCNILRPQPQGTREGSDLKPLSSEASLVSFYPLGACGLPVLNDALISQPLGIRASAAYLLLWLRVSGRGWSFIHD